MTRQKPSFFEKLIAVRKITPDQQRRGRLLARVIIITAIFDLAMILANLWLWVSAHAVVDWLYVLIGGLGLILLAGIWLLNQRGFATAAAALTLALYFARIGMISDPDRFALSFWAFFLPIFVAAFVIRPFVAFPAAGVSAIFYLLLSIALGSHEPVDIVIFKLFILLSLGLLSYFTASHLEWAVDSVNRSEAKYRNLFNNLPIGLYRTTPRGEILDVNAAFLKMFGFPNLETLKNLKASDLYAGPNSRDEFLAAIGSAEPLEMQMRRSDGTTFWVSDHVQPVRDASGEVIYYEGSLVNITERKRAEQELEQLAITDPVTGIANRRQFFSLAESAVNSTRRSALKVAVLMIDIDHFKAVNDRYGHVAGDAVLFEIAQRIRLSLRSGDICGRYGGEEFSVLLTDVDEREIPQMADRLCKNTGARPVITKGEKITVTISVGVAILDSATTPLEALLQRADQAMYAAKQAGRNQWKQWTPVMNISL